MATLDDLITPTRLRELAGPKAFERGQSYRDAGAVGRLRRSGERLTARVIGSDEYTTELQAQGEELHFSCSCPRAADGYFCKHGVALGLAFLDPDEPITAEAEHDLLPVIRAFLASQPHDRLVELLMDQAARDDGLSRSLLLKAERAGGAGDRLSASYREAIERAFTLRGFLDWHESGSYVSDIAQVTDSLEELLQPETAGVLVELTEYAIEKLDSALEQIDDSDGETSEVMDRLAGLHAAACSMARPDPVELAERLFHFELRSSFGAFADSARTYHDVLGTEGLQHFRELAEAQWAKITPRGPDDAYRPDDASNRWAITRIMETLARLSGDTEAIVAIKSRDLSSCYRYLDIAEIYRDANQPEAALDWAERGLHAFPQRPDNRLRDFLVRAYLDRGRSEDALQLAWVQFEERASLDHYRKLHDVATELGCWPQQREKALAQVETIALRAANEVTRWNLQPRQPDHSLRVEIALWENDLDAAWQAAHLGPCNRGLLLELANKLEPGRPVDALSLYCDVLPGVIEETNNRAYQEAIRYLDRVGGLMRRPEVGGDFGAYLGSLRVQYKLKRNFIKLLDPLMARATAR